MDIMWGVLLLPPTFSEINPVVLLVYSYTTIYEQYIDALWYNADGCLIHSFKIGKLHEIGLDNLASNKAYLLDFTFVSNIVI